jgi:hypothetical protein
MLRYRWASSQFSLVSTARARTRRLDLLVETFEHVGALEMLMVLAREAIEGQRFLAILLDPGDQFLIAGAHLAIQADRSRGASSTERRSLGSGLRPAQGQAPFQRSSCRQSSPALRGKWSRALCR